jgi:hypothetical protein
MSVVGANHHDGIEMVRFSAVVLRWAVLYLSHARNYRRCREDDNSRMKVNAKSDHNLQIDLSPPVMQR